MVLQTSGPISILDIQNEFGGTAPIEINEYYRGGAFVPSSLTTIPVSGEISFANFLGLAAYVYFKNLTTFGLAVGGLINGGGGSPVNTVHSVTWSSYATAVVTTAVLPVSISGHVYVTNETNANYIMNNTTTTRYIKTNLNTLTSALSVTSISSTISSSSAIHNNIKGINCGGFNSATSSGVTSGEKIIFATETLSTVAGVIPSTRAQAAAFTGYPSGVHTGYLVSGAVPVSGTFLSTVTKISLSTETGSDISGTMTGRSGISGICSENNGYASGGWRSGSSTYYASTTKVAFATDTLSTPTSAVLPSALHSLAGMGSNTMGFHTGGQNSALNRLSSVTRMPYSTETTAVSTALPATKAFHAAT